MASVPASGVQSVTSARASVREEQAGRVRSYLVAMSIRTACFVLAYVAHGLWRWTFAVAAIFLPFIAVVIANAVAPRPLGTVTPVPADLDHRRHLAH